MIKSIVAFAGVVVLTAASTFAELYPHQQQVLSAFAGEWYVAGMSGNLTEVWQNMSSTMGLSCGCPRFNITLCPSYSRLKVASVCDLQNATTSAIVGKTTTSGVMALERQVGVDEYLLLYSVHNTTVAISNTPFNQTITHDFAMELQSKLVFETSGAGGGCDGSGQPAGILSWSTSEPMGYKALMSSNSTLNETGYNELVNAADPEGAQGLVRLNTTCATTDV